VQIDQAAALGGCLASAPGREAERPLAAPNLAERILSQRKAPLVPLLARALWPLAAVAAGTLLLLGLNLVHGAKCSRLASRIAALEPERQKADQLRSELVRATVQIEHLDEIRGGVVNPAWDQVLLTIAQCLPEGAWLNRLHSDSHRRLAISGNCLDDEDAYEFVRWLDEAPGMTDVQLESMQPQRLPIGPATAFDVKVSLADISSRERKAAQENGASNP
jgi:Tfp pilus assembly protein PilN